jgi:hypothetical protein
MDFRTRRNLCRWAFLLLCILPTICIVGAAAFTNAPHLSTAARQRLEQQLASTLGLDVRIGEFSTGEHDSVSLLDVQLLDPESQHWVLRFRSAEAFQTARGLAIKVCQPEVRAADLPRLAALLHEHLLARQKSAFDSVQLTASSLVFHQEPRGESFESLQCQLHWNPDVTEWILAISRPGAQDLEPIRLRLVRNRQLDPAASGWELHTGNTPLPCSIATPWLSGLRHLGRDCTFRGSVWAEQGISGWSGELEGEFAHVDLDQLITNQFPHKLSGKSTLRIRQATMDAGYVTRATGMIQSQGGVISQSLLEAATESLGMLWHTRPRDVPLARYERLGLEFSMDANHLALVGQLDDEGSVLADADGSLLSTAKTGSLSTVAILRLLVPQSQVSVPATRETARLLHALPLPKIVPENPSTARRNYSPLRLR